MDYSIFIMRTRSFCMCAYSVMSTNPAYIAAGHDIRFQCTIRASTSPTPTHQKSGVAYVAFFFFFFESPKYQEAWADCSKGVSDSQNGEKRQSPRYQIVFRRQKSFLNFGGVASECAATTRKLKQQCRRHVRRGTLTSSRHTSRTASPGKCSEEETLGKTSIQTVQ